MSRTTSACGRVLKSLAFLGLVALGAARADAGFSVVKPTPYEAEATHAELLTHLYGGSFAADGVNYSNGTVTAKRCHDSGGGIMSALGYSAGADDRVWTGGLLTVTAVGRFAGYQQGIGYTLGAAGGGTVDSLFSLVGTGFNVTGSASVDMTGETFCWVRNGGGGTFSSDDAANGGVDQMVTYLISGAGGPTTWLLCWEDVLGVDSDSDYNDLVVMVQAASASITLPPAAIPLPPAVWSGLTILLGGGLWNVSRKIRRWLA